MRQYFYLLFLFLLFTILKHPYQSDYNYRSVLQYALLSVHFFNTLQSFDSKFNFAVFTFNTQHTITLRKCLTQKDKRFYSHQSAIESCTPSVDNFTAYSLQYGNFIRRKNGDFSLSLLHAGKLRTKQVSRSQDVRTVCHSPFVCVSWGITVV